MENKELKSKCCGVEAKESYTMDTRIAFSEGNQSAIICCYRCSKCHKPCEIEPEKSISEKLVNEEIQALKENSAEIKKLGKEIETPQPPIDWEDELVKKHKLELLYYAGGKGDEVENLLKDIRTHKKIWEDEAYKRGYEKRVDDELFSPNSN